MTFKFDKFCLSIILLFPLLFNSCSNSSQEKESLPTNKIVNKVLLIGIDGCRPDAMMEAKTPNLDALMENGTYSLDARCLYTTSSGPGWTSMLSGVWQNKHGVVNNSYKGAQFSKYPHFFKYIKEASPKSRTVSIVEWKPINKNMASLAADVFTNANSDADVKNKVANELLNNNPTALFVQLSNVDITGHRTGFSPQNPNYINAIETVDTQIGGMLDALKARKTYNNENWLILVSTDHGGLGTTHGGPSEEERTIFVIASGDNIPNKEIKKTTSQVTIPPVSNCLNSKYELKFDNTVVKISNNDNFNFGENQDFSIECRIRSKSPQDVSVLAKKNWSSGVQPGYIFSFKPNTNSFKVNVGDGANRIDVEAGEITDNQWHTVSATFDRDGLLKVYIDGVLKNSTSMATIGNINNNLPFTMGADGNLNYYYNGYLSEVRVFRSILSDTDINNWKCKVLDNSHPKYTNLLGHWKLTKGTGTTLNDFSSNKHNGIITNGVWNNARTSTVETVSNFNNTPRTVDVAVTALNHLCIPIKSSWNLEGKSIISTNCSNN
ncbi:alkaline phosphatase family protein [Polaribacter cellanae]|uniref:Alkaline phosphatase family protein n=1 Tax=Polaribacter cellanae TaxID=2818493 RepID=A0A975H7N1_9FLAO|nr:alkaline phosphatase family protein [Polaribacter cellanae]QTE23686.1 alkaline phosphatase family protein [Polaribacter cellanae]